MDKRIKLTAKQLTLIKRMKELLTKMKEEQLGIVSLEGNLCFYNKSNVIDTDSGYGVGDDNGDWFVEDGKVWITPEYEELTESEIRIPVDVSLYREEDWLCFAVEPSTQEEMDALTEQGKGVKEERKQYLQQTIAECEAEKQKYLKKIEDALNSDGLPQKGKDYQKQLYTNKIKDLDAKISNAQKVLDEL